MPLDTVHWQQSAVAGGGAKRTHDAWEQEEESRKRHKKVREEKRRTLPDPCTNFIELRFQLVRFKGVYRVARLPLTFTFANLYMFILYIFGWSGYHSHRFEVVGCVQMYSAQYKKGEIKSYGRAIPEEPDRFEDPQEYFDWFFKYRQSQREPLVVLASRKEGFERYTRSSDPFGFEAEGTEHRDDGDMTLGEVWSPKERRNLTKGECSNEELGIKLEYDLGASWEVHITINDPSKCWLKLQTPSNLPEIVAAKGAPPIEDAHGWISGELQAKDKSVSPFLFDSASFVKYLNGEYGSCARKRELAVYDMEEENARCAAKAKAKKEAAREKERERAERRARGEESDEDEDEEDEDEEDEDEYE